MFGTHDDTSCDPRKGKKQKKQDKYIEPMGFAEIKLHNSKVYWKRQKTSKENV